MNWGLNLKELILLINLLGNTLENIGT